jgi:hypothetical protein
VLRPCLVVSVPGSELWFPRPRPLIFSMDQISRRSPPKFPLPMSHGLSIRMMQILLCSLVLLVGACTAGVTSSTGHHVDPDDSSRPNVLLERIAFGSCNKPKWPQKLWESIVQQQPQLWLWTGDAVYVVSSRCCWFPRAFGKHARAPQISCTNRYHYATLIPEALLRTKHCRMGLVGICSVQHMIYRKEDRNIRHCSTQERSLKAHMTTTTMARMMRESILCSSEKSFPLAQLRTRRHRCLLFAVL